MKFLRNYFGEFKKESILCPLFKFIEAIISLLIPLIVARIIDRGIRYSNTSYITTQVIYIIVLGIVGYIIAIIAQYFAARASTGIAAAIREDLYKKVQKLTYSDIDKLSESTLINGLTNDINQIQTGVNLFLRLILRSPLIVLGSLILAFTTSIKIGILFLATIIVLCFIIISLTKKAYPIYKKSQDMKDILHSKTNDTLTGARVIRAFGIEKDTIDDFSSTNNKYSRFEKNANKYAALTSSLSICLINIGIMYVIILGSKQVAYGSLSTGQVVMLYNFMAQILIEIVKLTNLIMQIPKTLSSTTRVEEMLTYKIRKDSGKTLLKDDEPIKIEFKDVSLKYKGNKAESLSNISFDIEEGDLVGIVGPTGSGKSSLCNLIPKLYKPTDGQILINGIESIKLSTKDLREIVSIMNKDSKIVSGTIQSNIEFSDNKLSNDEINQALADSLSSDIIENKDLGLKEKIAENGANISGGQRQRLLIARALAKKPKILILDEPTVGLDAKTKKELLNKLKKEKSGRITIIASTKVSNVKDCDKIIVLDNGKIVGFGNNIDLLQDCSTYKQMYDTQSKKEVLV